MDLLLAAMATAGVFYYAENRCAGVAALVEERGVPTVEAIPWMEKGDYTITPLNRPPEGQPSSSFSWLPGAVAQETADGSVSYTHLDVYKRQALFRSAPGE